MAPGKLSGSYDILGYHRYAKYAIIANIYAVSFQSKPNLPVPDEAGASS